MVYAPGHFQRADSRRTGSQPATPGRYRTRRERLFVQAATALTLVLLGVVVFSLANHQRRSGKGCIDFNYTTMIGGAEMYKCGAQARMLCATRPGGKSVDTDFSSALHAACRQAGIVPARP